MTTLATRRTMPRMQRSPPKCGDYWIRLKIPASALEDAWELYEIAKYYGGVKLQDCCFAFANEERRSAAVDALRLRLGHEYLENVDVSEIDIRTRLLFLARDDESVGAHCRFFAEHGYLVSQAGNWAESLDILRHWGPDIVVVNEDMLWDRSEGMHEVDQVCAALATTPVVLIGEQRLPESSMSRPAFAVIARFHEAVSADCLLNTIRSVMCAQKAGRNQDLPSPARGTR